MEQIYACFAAVLPFQKTMILGEHLDDNDVPVAICLKRKTVVRNGPQMMPARTPSTLSGGVCDGHCPALDSVDDLLLQVCSLYFARVKEMWFFYHAIFC